MAVFLAQMALLAAQLPLAVDQLMRMVVVVPIVQLLATLLAELQLVALLTQLAEQVVMERVAVLADLAQMVVLVERQTQMALHLVVVAAAA
jgi:hypothetical protein